MSDAPTALPSLVVIVVNWNGREVLPDCLGSLRESGYPDLRVIMVDNASTDHSVPWTRKHHPEVEVLETGANRRWAGGNNAALDLLADEGWPCDHALLLNNDTIVPEGSLERLTAAVAADPQAMAGTPRIVYASEPSRLWYDGGQASTWTGWVRHEGIRQQAGRRGTEPRPVGYGTGCALLITREGFACAGRLDERYHFYGEDVDWCLRLRRRGGLILHVPRAVVLHKVSASLGAASPAKVYLRSRSHVRLLRTHARGRQWPVLWPAQIAYQGAHALWHCWHGRPATALALWQGVLDELRDRPVDTPVMPMVPSPDGGKRAARRRGGDGGQS